MAALQLIALDTTTPQLRAPASGDTYSAPRAIAMTPEGLTGSSATSSLAITQTWNTTGTPSAIDLNVTDTASNAASNLLNLRVGGVSQFSVTKTGICTATVGASSTNAFTTNGRVAGTGGVFGGSNAVLLDSVLLAVSHSVQWSSTSSWAGAKDLFLVRDAANTLALRNGVNAQAFNIYNTYTDASNYERGVVRWSGTNRLQIGAEALGTGTQRDLDIQGTSVTVRIGTTSRWYFYSSYHFGPAGDATQDIGTSSFRVRNFFQGGGYHEMAEMTAPSAPAANGVRIYAEDNGSGKTRLMALFATGAAQQIAIEP